MFFLFSYSYFFFIFFYFVKNFFRRTIFDVTITTRLFLLQSVFILILLYNIILTDESADMTEYWKLFIGSTYISFFYTVFAEMWIKS